MAHKSVLLQEVITGLAIKADGVYLDGTFGRGGHSRAILAELSSQGRLYAIDKDHAAIAYAQQYFTQDSRFHIKQDTFANLKQFAEEENIYRQIDGILLDLGVSSPQLDEPQRGFSFLQEGPLDMRMDVEQALNAAEYVNTADEQHLIEIFKTYGEERYASRIAKAIIAARTQKLITSTVTLAAIVKEANPKWEKHKHPATRVFQAIRIYINRELEDLKEGLQQAVDILKVGGRLVVISFHSLEDRIVKQFMRDQEQGQALPSSIPIPNKIRMKSFKRIGKAIKPSDNEVKCNIRARSAVLRIGEKLA